MTRAFRLLWAVRTRRRRLLRTRTQALAAANDYVYLANGPHAILVSRRALEKMVLPGTPVALSQREPLRTFNVGEWATAAQSALDGLADARMQVDVAIRRLIDPRD